LVNCNVDSTKRVICGRLGDQNLSIEGWPFSIFYPSLQAHRYLTPFHFAKEWNNFGYGHIKIGDPFWGFTTILPMDTPCTPVGILQDKEGNNLGLVAAIFDEPERSTLWFSRPAGPVDGFDQCLVERFYSDHRWEELGSLPYIKEIPWGFEAAATMRIDCDESVSTGRPLFELYKKNRLPFGLAIKTEQNLSEGDLQLMRDVIGAGGTVVTHSHTHAPNWGGSREKAKWEVEQSHQALRELQIPGINYRYAVSPFHQNPKEAVEGIRDAGIEMFVGGIACNDPEYLMGRAGPAFEVPGIMTHSQQCMLHGDCIHQDNNSLKQYFEAFDLACKSETFFGYLDHPFSSYHYGWLSEEERLQAHQEFIDYLMKRKIWFASLERALDFLGAKNEARVWADGDRLRYERSKKSHHQGLPEIVIHWRGKDFRAAEFEISGSKS